ncbi:hypothetical protein SAMN05660649_00643 [Desulfotomaculum arcticum]|uniref:Uncharacterized protein n=1 Tax=Desulfotruncus arcticus DSM 17038 TaxID=1121424 RepID=A0A1I2P6Z5_9FIRM|nr:hypothetical protein [Desulfotruncus arcticus]SFG09231.1 hypothetical protein SAMN05660649_00643 [Desulfotomaculum arcticum] [Desulfotruncus arcticus DSM 17038]
MESWESVQQTLDFMEKNLSREIGIQDLHLLTTDALDKAVKYMYDTWLLKNEIKTEPFMVELYSDTSAEDVLKVTGTLKERMDQTLTLLKGTR